MLCCQSIWREWLRYFGRTEKYSLDFRNISQRNLWNADLQGCFTSNADYRELIRDVLRYCCILYRMQLPSPRSGEGLGMGCVIRVPLKLFSFLLLHKFPVTQFQCSQESSCRLCTGDRILLIQNEKRNSPNTYF